MLFITTNRIDLMLCRAVPTPRELMWFQCEINDFLDYSTVAFHQGIALWEIKGCLI